MLAAAAIDYQVCGPVCEPVHWQQMKLSFNQFLAAETEKLEPPWNSVSNSTFASIQCQSLFFVCHVQATLHVLGKALKKKLPNVATYIAKHHPLAAALLFPQKEGLVMSFGQTFIAHGNCNIQAGGNVTYSAGPATKSSVFLEDIISRNDVWPNIGERIPEIQLELDAQLRKSSKSSSAAWFHVVTSAQGGPRGKTKALFSEATQQMCLPEVIRAVSKVLPRTGSYFDQLQIIEIPIQKNQTQISAQGQSFSTMNPFVESMEIQYQTKSMLASTLLSQRDDVPLKKLVARLMLTLGENDAWLKFAKAKGATSGAAAEKRISDAQATGEPESIVIPMIVQAPGYLALTFLSELKSMVNARHVSEVVEKIEEHLVCVESSTQERGNKVAQVNSSIRQWIIKNELCDTTSQAEIQARVDSLKDYEVTSLDDLKILDIEDFQKCGFRGVKAKKAYAAAQNEKK